MLRLTEKQVALLIEVVSDEIVQIEDYIADGTYGDHDQAELDYVKERLNDLQAILIDLQEY